MTVAQIYEDFAQPLKADFVPGATAARIHGNVPALPPEGRNRVVIENVAPEINAGRHPAKSTVGERVIVEADLFADSHVSLSATVKYRPADGVEWSESPMERVA